MNERKDEKPDRNYRKEIATLWGIFLTIAIVVALLMMHPILERKRLVSSAESAVITTRFIETETYTITVTATTPWSDPSPEPAPENGTALSEPSPEPTFTGVVVDEDMARIHCKALVRENLLVPKSARFSRRNEWTLVPIEHGYSVRASVTSENLFGVEIKSDFECTVVGVEGDSENVRRELNYLETAI